MKYYYTSNIYLGGVINEYFREKQLWDRRGKDKDVDYADVNYSNTGYNCDNCKIINQFGDIDLLGNKMLQYKNIIKFYKYKPSFIPTTYTLHTNKINNYKNLFNNNKYWIVKPINSLSRRGIKVVNNLNNLNKWISMNHKWDEWIIQEYIKNPLLLNGRKFHFRVYVIVIKNSKKLKIFMYNKGFIYTSDTKYNELSTNNNSTLSGENRKENVFVFPDDFILHFGTIKYYKYVMPQLKKIIKKCIYPVADSMRCPNKGVKNYKCFKLLGFDILIDTNYKLYLAEINARNISFKYPPKKFLNTFYPDILNLILNKKKRNLIEISKIYDTSITSIIILVIFVIILTLFLIFKFNIIN